MLLKDKLCTMLLISDQTVLNGLDAGLSPVKDFIWTILCQFVSPITTVCLLAILVFQLAKTGFKMEQIHQMWTEHTFNIVLLLILIFITGSVSIWGKTMLG